MRGRRRSSGLSSPVRYSGSNRLSVFGEKLVAFVHDRRQQRRAFFDRNPRWRLARTALVGITLLGCPVPPVLLTTFLGFSLLAIRALWAFETLIIGSFVIGMAALGRSRWRQDRDPGEAGVALAFAAIPVWSLGIFSCLMLWIPGEPMSCWALDVGIWILAVWVLAVPLVAAGLDFRRFLRAMDNPK